MKIWFQIDTIWLHPTFIWVRFFCCNDFGGFDWTFHILITIGGEIFQFCFLKAHLSSQPVTVGLYVGQSLAQTVSLRTDEISDMSILNFFPCSLITWYNVLDLQIHSDHSLNDFLNYSYSHFTEAYRVLYKVIKRVSLYLQIHGLCPSYVLPLSFLGNKTFAFLLIWDNYNSDWD